MKQKTNCFDNMQNLLGKGFVWKLCTKLWISYLEIPEIIGVNLE